MEILNIFIGGLMVFVSFYSGIKVGQKLIKNEPVRILPKKKGKIDKVIDDMADDLDKILNFKDEG